jgi:Protein of unknown function (DUF3006)
MHDGKHQWVVDSIEERAASIEVDGKDMLTLPLWLIPDGAKEGDVLAVQHERPAKGQRSMLTITVDAAATKKALAESVAQVKKSAPAKDAGGDIIL